MSTRSKQKRKSRAPRKYVQSALRSSIVLLAVSALLVLCGYWVYSRLELSSSDVILSTGPTIESWLPGDNQEIVLDGDIKVTFSTMMDEESTKRAFSLLDGNQVRIPGELVMEDYSRSLRFIPGHLLSPNQTYHLIVSTEARDSKNNHLANVFNGTVHTTDRLFGTTVYPFDGASNVDLQAPIRIIFNRPIVSIGVPNQQLPAENIISVDPSIVGTGTWESESVYRFIPESSLVSGTKYTITVNSKAVNRLVSNTVVLPQDVRWQFETVPVSVTSVYALHQGDNASQGTKINFYYRSDRFTGTNLLPTDLIVVEFGQPMKPDNVGQYITVTDVNLDPIHVEMAWDPEFKQLTINPGASFQRGQDYSVNIQAGALALDGGSFEKTQTALIKILPEPGVLSVSPKPDEADGVFYKEYEIIFLTDMDPTSFSDKVVFYPPLNSDIKPYYDQYAKSLTFYGLQPSTNYVVQILPGIKDVYGNVLSNWYELRFVNGAIPPTAYLDLPDTEPIIYRTGGPLEFYTYYVNVQYVKHSLYKITQEQFISFSTSYPDFNKFVPNAETLVWEQTITNVGQLNQESHEKITFTGLNRAPLEPGYYYLGISSDKPEPQQPTQEGRLIALVDANLTLKLGALDSLLWLTDLTTGEPIPNIHVSLYQTPDILMGEGLTDSSGLVHMNHIKPFDPREIYYAVASERNAVAISNWKIGYSDYDQISPYEFREYADKPMVYLYTERPVYRPEQLVYFKGMARLSNDFSYSLPGRNQISQVEIVIEDFSNKVVYHEFLPLSAYGTFNDSFQLQRNAPLGNYKIKASIGMGIVNEITFNVAEYRRQTFEVELTPNRQNLLPGENLSASLQAHYLSGGFVSNAKVKLAVESAPYLFTPTDAAFNNYSFSEDDSQPFAPLFSSETGNFELITDAEGKASIDLPAVLNPRAGQKITVAATITDIAGNTVNGHTTAYVHPSERYIGLRAQFNSLNYQQEQRVDIVVLDWNQNPVTNQALTIDLLRERWYRLDREVDGERIADFSSDTDLVQSFQVTTDENGFATIKFAPLQGGVYQVRALTMDSYNNDARSSIKFLVNEPSAYVPWKMGVYQDVTIVTDKDEYSIGDTAHISISSPFQGPAYALVTIERASIKDARVILLENNNTEFNISIAKNLTPNAYISVVVVKGVDGSISRPSYALGLAELKVNHDEQEMVIDIQTPPQVMPGQDLNLKILTHDKHGQPVQAEISLAVTDLAALQNQPLDTTSILDAFYRQRWMQVATFTSLALSAEEYNYRRENNLLTGESMGGGGWDIKGDGIIGVLKLREKFPDTAFWAPMIETNEHGEVSINLPLPDNATSWLIDVRGITLENTLVGQSSKKVVSTRPLLISPQTPYFFVAGDKAFIGALLHNNTDQPMQGTVNLEIEDGASLIDTPAAQTFTVNAQNSILFYWLVGINMDAQRVDLVFSAQAGEFSDSTRPPQGHLDRQGIPVIHYDVPNSFSISGILTDKSDVAQHEFSNASPFVAKDLIIELAPSLWGGMQNSIQYVSDSSLGGTEQIVSRFLPQVTLLHYLDNMGLISSYIDIDFRQQINADLNQIAQIQNPDGGWGWLAYQESDDLVTGYVLLGLMSAENAGYSVYKLELERATNYLLKSVESSTGLSTPQQLNKRAFILYVLSEAGQIKESDAVALYDGRDNLSIYAKAFLAMALHSVNSRNPRVQNLLNEIDRFAIQSGDEAHWQEGITDAANWNTNTRTTSIVLSALIRIKPKHELIDKAMQWLISNRIEGRWQSNQEITWAIIALTDWSNLRKESQPNYQYTVNFNGQQLSQAFVNPDSLQRVNTVRIGNNDFLTEQPNQLVLHRTQGPGSLYYSAYLRMSSPVETITPIEQGIFIAREYVQPELPGSTVTQAQLGDVILGRLTINVPQELNYVVIEDPIPAGMDASIWTPNAMHNDYLKFIGWSDIFTETSVNARFLHTAELHDDKIVIYATKLTAGSYVYTYLLRASTRGIFHVLPPYVQELYNPNIFGQGSGSIFEILPK